MLVQKKMSSTRKMLLTIFILLIFLAIGLIFYFNYSSNSTTPAVSGGLAGSDVSGQPLPQVNIQFSTDFLKKEPFISLRPSGRTNIVPQPVGRSNPFNPIPFGIIVE